MRLFLFFICINFCYLICAQEFKLEVQENKKLYSVFNLISRALKSSNQQKINNYEFRISQAKSRAYWAPLLPKINLRASRMQEFNFKPQSQASLLESGIKFSASLLDFAKIGELQENLQLSKAAQKDLDFKTEQRILKIFKLYIRALISQADKNIAQEKRQNFIAQRDSLVRQAALGRARVLDVTRAEFHVNQAHSDFLISMRDYDRALGLLGVESGESKEFDIENFDLHIDLPTEELLDLTPDFESLKLQISAHDLGIKSQWLDFLPKLKFELDSGFNFPDYFINSSNNFRYSTRFMLGLDLPLFAGGQRFFVRREKIARKYAAEFSLQQRKLELKLELSGLKNSLEVQKQVIKSAQLALQTALKTQASAKRLFNLGMATALEVIQADVDLFSSRSKLAQLKLELVLKKLKYVFRAGRIRDYLSPNL